MAEAKVIQISRPPSARKNFGNEASVGNSGNQVGPNGMGHKDKTVASEVKVSQSQPKRRRRGQKTPILIIRDDEDDVR